MDERAPIVATTPSERQWAAMAHLAALVLAFCTSWIAGIAGVLGAGLVFLLKRDGSAFVATHAREAMNFNLSMFIYACVATVLGVILVGATLLTLGLGAIVTLPAGLLLLALYALIALAWLVCSIVAIARAWGGEDYRYPLTLRLI